MSFARFLGIFGCVLGISAGQVLFKIVANRMQGGRGVFAVALDPYLWAAGVIYIISTFLWLWQLKYVELSRAYPVFALAFLVVPIVGWFFLDERVHASYFFGVALIIAGVILTTH
jgi:drug/metabolite transporter (DMT)-like permease